MDNMDNTQPTEPVAPLARTTATGTPHVRLWIAGSIAILAVLMCCATALPLAALGSRTPTPTAGPNTAHQQQAPTAAPRAKPTSTPKPKPTATPRPKATATPNPNVLAQAYILTVTPELDILQTDFTNMGQDCSALDYSACKTDLQQIQSDVSTFQDILNANPPPPCLTSVDNEIRVALADYNAGASVAIQGIDNSDPNLINQGSAEINDGNTAINQANTDTQTAHCGQ